MGGAVGAVNAPPLPLWRPPAGQVKISAGGALYRVAIKKQFMVAAGFSLRHQLIAK